MDRPSALIWRRMIAAFIIRGFLNPAANGVLRDVENLARRCPEGVDIWDVEFITGALDTVRASARRSWESFCASDHPAQVWERFIAVMREQLDRGVPPEEVRFLGRGGGRDGNDGGVDKDSSLYLGLVDGMSRLSTGAPNAISEGPFAWRAPSAPPAGANPGQAGNPHAAAPPPGQLP